MSYDFFVWSGPLARNPDDVFDLIEAVSEGDPTRLESSPKLGTFLSDLFAEYPPLAATGSAPTPWSFTDDVSDRHALLSVQDPSHPVCRRIISLSRKHRLFCFDLQTGDRLA